jgi:hypothetical protein
MPDGGAPALAQSREQILMAARLQLRAEPLAAEGLAIAGQFALPAGTGQAQAALEEALRRDPRSALARVGLAQAAALRGEVPSLASQLAQLARIDRGQSGAYIRALAALVEAPTSRSATLTEVQKHEGLLEEVVKELNRSGPDMALLLELNRMTPALHGGLVARAVSERGPRAGLLVWLSLMPDEQATQLRWPIDPDFTGTAGAAPFAWVLHPEQAEFQAHGGLYVTFFGRTNVVLATQLISLSPGRYTVTTSIQGTSEARGGQLAWRLHCDGAAASSSEILFPRLTGQTQAVEGLIEVPASGCDIQALRLTGLAGEFPLWVRAELERVAIAPEPAQ